MRKKDVGHSFLLNVRDGRLESKGGARSRKMGARTVMKRKGSGDSVELRMGRQLLFGGTLSCRPRLEGRMPLTKFSINSKTDSSA